MRTTTHGRSGRVLVLGSDTRSFLAVVRSLGRSGLDVHVAWCERTSIASRSRYVTLVHDLPPYAADSWSWRHALSGLLARLSFDLVVPCDDPSILPLYVCRAELERLARIYLLDEEAFRVTSDKELTHQLATQLGIDVPRSSAVENLDQARAVAKELGFPIVVKPRSSFTLQDTTTKRTVALARSESDLSDVLNCDAVGAQLQEFVGGFGAGVEVLAKDGRVLVAFQHVRLHEPLRGGGSSYRRSAALDDDLLSAATAMVAALRYTGVAMFEFRIDPATGRKVLLEINGRFWGSLPLALAAGIDFPRYLYDMLVNGQSSFPSVYRSGIHARNWAQDLYWFAERIGSDDGRRVVARDLAKAALNVIRGRERSDTLTLDDPRPALLEAREIASTATETIERKVRQRIRRTGFSRRRAQRRFVAQFRSSTRVLFLCKGNICRSAFGEHYARRVLPPSIEIRSAGLLPLAGRTSPQSALAAARRLGVDLAAHRSSTASAGVLAEADLVVVFDDEHLQGIREKFPAARAKTHLLGVLQTSEDPVISDPYGSAEETFDRVFERIAHLLDLLGALAVPDGAPARVGGVEHPGGKSLIADGPTP